MFLIFYCISKGSVYVSVLDHNYIDSTMIRDFLNLDNDEDLVFVQAVLDDALGDEFADYGMPVIYYHHGEMFYA